MKEGGGHKDEKNSNFFIIIFKKLDMLYGNEEQTK